MMLTRFGEPNTLKRVIKIKIKEKFPVRKTILENNQRLNNFDKLSILDQKTYLISMLIRQDKMGMAANLENRVPYLDHELAEFVFSLPLKEKIEGLETKSILKKIAEKYIPRECIYRPKVGFGQPISEWLKNPEGLGKYLKLFKNKKRSFINYQQLDGIINEHKTNQKDHSQTLWILINLELWLRIFFDKEPYQTIWPNLK
jgi:asparagine synthase (glutamine-hydrolysing)